MRYIVRNLEVPNSFNPHPKLILSEQERNNLKFTLYDMYFKNFYKGMYFFQSSV